MFWEIMAFIGEHLESLNETWDEYSSLIWVLIILFYLFKCSAKRQNNQNDTAQVTTGASGGIGESSSGDFEIHPTPKEHLRQKKSIATTYTLFFAFGFITGTHHFYLESPTWAFTHFITVGYCGLGMMADFFLIPYYVHKFNKQHCAPDAEYDKSFRGILRMTIWGPMLLIALVCSLFFFIPLFYEICTNTYLADGKLEMNPFLVLGVETGASMDTVKSAFRKLSLEYHPDKNMHRPEEAQKKMSEINSAMDKIKKGTHMSADSFFSDEYITMVSNKWTVLIDQLGQWTTEKQNEYRDKVKSKNRTKKRMSGRKESEIFSEEFMSGTDAIFEMTIGIPLFDDLSKEPPIAKRNTTNNSTGYWTPGTESTTSTTSSTTSDRKNSYDSNQDAYESIKGQNTAGDNRNGGAANIQNGRSTEKARKKLTRADIDMDALRREMGDLAHMVTDEFVDEVLRKRNGGEL